MMNEFWYSTKTWIIDFKIDLIKENLNAIK